MTDDRRPEDDLDITFEDIELDGTQDSVDTIVSPEDGQAAKIDATKTADLSELDEVFNDEVFNIDDLELMAYGSGSNPGLTKQVPPLLEEEIDAVAETIATHGENQRFGTEPPAEYVTMPVETAVKPVDDQHEVSDSQVAGEQARTAAICLDNPPSVKRNSAAGTSGKLPLFGLLFGLLGIAAGLGAGYYAYTLQGKLAVLDHRVEATVQTSLPAEEAPAEVARLQNRVEEVATLIEESNQMNDSSGEEIDSLKSRIAKMEQEIGGLRDKATDSGPATEAQTPAPASAARISPPPAAGKGSWAVNLVSYTSEEAATTEVNRLRGPGINAEKYVHIKDGTTWYRVRVPGFSSSAEAQAYAENAFVRTGFPEAWIGRTQ